MFTLSMLLSHTFSDFVLQTGNMINGKRAFHVKNYILHGAVLLLTSLPFLMLLERSSMRAAFPSVIFIAASHIGIDYLKEALSHHQKVRTAPKIVALLLFLSDQALHILIILAVTSGSSMMYNDISVYITDTFMNGEALSYGRLRNIFLILYISFSGVYFIPLILDKVYEKVEGYTDILNEILKVGEATMAHGFIDEVKAGKWIGILERVLMVIFLNLGAFSSIGIIIAVKSLARFKMMENKIFAEYYLMGTLFSVVYTFITYGALQIML